MDLNKNHQIKSIIKHLFDKFGETSFKINDHWDADLNAIGVTDINEKYLVYISSDKQDVYYVALENLTNGEKMPYEEAGEFLNIDLEKLEEIISEHLKIRIR